MCTDCQYLNQITLTTCIMCDAELLAENEIKVNAPPKKRKDEFRPIKVKS